MARSFVIGVAVLAAAICWSRAASSHETVNTTVLFDREIVAILNRHCVMCHAEHGPSFPLETYEQVWLQKRKVSAAGRFQYEARVGRHDDLVLAVALALWLCVGRPVMPPPQFSFYSRSAPSSHLGTRAGNGRHVPSPGQPDSAAYDASPRSFWRMIDDIGEINK